MKIRSILLATLVLVCKVATSSASPITYDFSGTLSQSINGSTAFSGTFSYDPIGMEFGSGNLLTRWLGSHATLNVGGESYEFKNYMLPSGSGNNLQLPGPSPNYTFDANSIGQGDNFTFQAADGKILGSSDQSAPTVAMTIHLGDPSGTAFPPSSPNLPLLNLTNFSVRDFSVTIPLSGPSVTGTMAGAATIVGGTPITGTITSLSLDPQPQNIPEPTSLVVLATIGLAVATQRRFRSTS
jgi:hypothetical protein